MVAAFTCCLVIVAVLQLCTMRSTDDTPKHTLERQKLDQRAWLSLGNATITEPLNMEQDGVATTLIFELKNTGKLSIRCVQQASYSIRIIVPATAPNHLICPRWVPRSFRETKLLLRLTRYGNQQA